MLTRLFLISVTLLFSASSYAKHFVVGVERIQYLPQYTHDAGEYGGFARQFLDMWAKDNNHTVEYKILPISRLFKELLKPNSELDFKYPDNSYWQQDMKKGKNVTYSDAVVDYIDGVVVTPGNMGKGKQALKKLGTARGFTAWDYLGDIKSKAITVKENNSFAGLLKQVISGRVDGAYINIAVARYHLANQLKQPGAVVFDPNLPHTKSAYHLSTIKHPKVLEDFNKWMKKNQGDVAALKQKWGVNAM
ncbi:substrate-binding periplasmic protein [Pseudobacteriovorax antillogorgiicola]|uniref:Extracellular solute-binding protein, family 3 n=1 Tax=Pseudobacteriovorax antillogorgiicola TaxID=1513793 RepID=A0A1Y6CFN1_9BACT|nr:transporter substrate-binding domain-containing protein [Pseudobacteriovorax antillogorgiicola]TCS51770.1 extracellular solute-binding protein (family 3) [Pseudobacteriovorax antillogorgiicola]SMF49858.1 extracellular solute-binding protein, family 3 [Pseudobacteriovorax antillogorgiicola]